MFHAFNPPKKIHICGSPFFIIFHIFPKTKSQISTLFRLIEFFSDKKVIDSALSRLSEADAIAEQERHLTAEVVARLGLVRLERDIGVSSKEMIECCTRLLQFSGQILHLSHGAHLLVDRYYSLESDGTLVIPYNWKEE